MNKSPHIPLDTLQRQQTAGSPGHSVWVSANAGSGKTEILVQRVIRLLLEGARPSSILCLTFTKAAAAEMMSRTFKRLGEWMSLPDKELFQAIGNLTGHTPAPAILARARRLFADALETPGGLKVQTIHAFCEHLLHMFPIDANVPANFSVMDDTHQSRLRDTVLTRLVADMAHGSPSQRECLIKLSEVMTPDGLESLAREALADNNIFSEFEITEDARNQYHSELRKLANIKPAETLESICDDFYKGQFWQDHAPELARMLRANKTPTNRATGEQIKQAMEQSQKYLSFLNFYTHLVIKSGDIKKPASLLTDKFRKEFPIEAAQFDDMVTHAAAVHGKLNTIEAIDRSWAGVFFLTEFIRRYKLAKAERGALDFDDLIGKTRTLLHRQDIAPWILYKLDYGLSHILIDEAQDTSPEQWDIITKLSEEFTVGDSSGASNRTIFAVGDEKQSIYGFQGAAPDLFGETKKLMDRRHRGAGRALADVKLILSFRSTEEVLSAVDRTFAHGTHARGLVFDDALGIMPHQSLRRADPGFVELWPQEHGQKDEEAADPWSDTTKDSDSVSAREALANRIANYIRHLLRHGDPTGRTITADDIMILVRHRGTLFETLIQSLKRHRLPVAGADRLKLKSHIAVQDLLALGRACLIPGDDFNLALLLKSPLFGLTDDDLLKFAPLRAGSLNDAWHEHVEKTGEFRLAWERLQEWRTLSASHGPFAFYARIMESDGGRRAMLQRLGPEAKDAMNEFMRRVHEFDMHRHASLMAFLIEFENSDIEIKRDFAHGNDEIRIMTVHAAKGLEAPIVILPDTITPPTLNKSRLLSVETSSGKTIPFWSSSPRGETSLVRPARAREAIETENEYRRLLYVAMTRARNGLVICGAAHADAKEGSWYGMISTALRAQDEAHGKDGRGKLVTVPGFDDADVERWMVERDMREIAKAAEPEQAPTPPSRDEPLPDWLFQDAPQPAPAPAPLIPSGAGSTMGAAQSANRAGLEAARTRGRLVHALLEHLPQYTPEQRADAAHAIARRMAGDRAAQFEQVLAQVIALLERTDLRHLFGPDARAEAAITGRITMADGTVKPVLGVVDRLLVRDEAVWVADFKTAPVPPPHAEATPTAIVTQLALYRAILRDIFPEKPVRCLVIWTAGPAVHELTDQQLDAALAHVTAA